jgi:peptidoglycan/LPS O-acetylase OafA/YrhL
MRIVLYVAVFLLGVAVALAAIAVHRDGPVRVGLVLAVATTFVVAWALRQQRIRRLVAAYSFGWLAMFGLVIAGRPEGDFAIAGDFDGYAMMFAGFVLVIVAMTSLTSARDRSSRRTSA